MLSPEQMIIRLLVAVLLGSVVGLERERHDKSAGLRTHMVVCVGAALTMIVSIYGFNEVLGRQATVLDPSRVAAQVVSGIGFLGAGIIIFRRDVVIGLTTAAGIWAIAAVGLAVGAGLYLASIVATVMIIVVIVAIRPLETRLHKSRKQLSLTVLVDRNTSMSQIEDTIRTVNGVFKGLRVEPTEKPGNYSVNILLDSLSDKQAFAIVDQLKKVPGIHRAEIGN